ncbi:MAG TPA: hypothetical protein PLU64_03170, partial [Saprospiraceae bacterium]|nr:hypothetical protein [Saprospiraceae bacterium]
SIDIWREVVESAISTVDPKTYREAKPVLIHIRDTYRKIGQPGQWQIYLETLRSKHKRKRRLMEVLAEVG